MVTGTETLKGTIMNNWLLSVLVLSLYASDVTQLSIPLSVMPLPEAPNQLDGLAIKVTTSEVGDALLRLSYEMRNASEYEVWVCSDVGYNNPVDCETVCSVEHQLVTLRRRLNVPANVVFSRRPMALYTRLLPGEIRRESWSVDLPLQDCGVFRRHESDQATGNVTYIPRLAIEIGYYAGNLPELIHNRIEEAQATYDPTTGRKPPIMDLFGDARSLNYSREGLKDRDREMVLPYSYQELKGERILRDVVGGLRIPCERRPRQRVEAVLGLEGITRLEMRFRPSFIGYLFPFAVEQNLLSDTEIQKLEDLPAIPITDRRVLDSFAKAMVNSLATTGVVREDVRVHFACFRRDVCVASFNMYNDQVIRSEDGRQTSYLPTPLDVGLLVPEIQALQRRVRCAANLRDLYCRLRQYAHTIETPATESGGGDTVVYPPADRWLTAMTTSLGPIPSSIMKMFFASKLQEAHACPSVDRMGRVISTYAMNPYCTPESSANTVLLFETGAGWNQHGGPELFTFDNHDPRGGLVLLNDGTVKFIRTEEELKQLRWK